MQYNIVVETKRSDDSIVNHSLILTGNSFLDCIYALSSKTAFGTFRGCDEKNSNKTKRVYRFEKIQRGVTLHTSTATVEQIGTPDRKIIVKI
jgi:hypothetical protein